MKIVSRGDRGFRYSLLRSHQNIQPLIIKILFTDQIFFYNEKRKKPQEQLKENPTERALKNQNPNLFCPKRTPL